MNGEHDQAAQFLAGSKDLVDKVLQHGARLDKANYPQHLEDGDGREEESW